MKKIKILITNDDGVGSPGLRAAVEAVVDMGEVMVLAPSNQQTGTGRALTGEMQSRLEPIDYRVNGKSINAYHCKCSPAMIVRHSFRTILRESRPDLLISGINYGENLGFNVTCSGTVGAALEAASYGIKSLAISKQTDMESHLSYSDQNWEASKHFLRKFSERVLENNMQPDVDVLKIDVPIDATPDTAWKITKLARCAYYYRKIEQPGIQTTLGDGKVAVKFDADSLDSNTDIYALAVGKIVSVTPLSLDMTSRIEPSDLKNVLNVDLNAVCNQTNLNP